MIQQTILDYIQKEVEKGASLEAVRLALSKVGWNQQDVNDTIEYAKEHLKLEAAAPKPASSPAKKSNFDFVLVLSLVVIVASAISLAYFIFSIA